MATYHSKAKRLEEEFRQRMLYGEWPVGAMLPSRAVLAEEYGVAINTIRRVMEEMAEQGILRLDPHRGAVVTASASTSVAPAIVAANSDAETTTLDNIIGVLCPMEMDVFRETSEFTRYYHNFNLYTLNALERELSAQGAHCLTVNPYNLSEIDHNFSPFQNAARQCLAMGAQAIVGIDLLGATSMGMEGMLSDLQNSSVPALAIVDGPLALPFPHIYNHHHDMGYLAAEALLRNGYRHQTFVTPFIAPWVDERIAGARLAISRQRGDIVATFDMCTAVPPQSWRYTPDSGAEIMRETKIVMQRLLTNGVLFGKRSLDGPPGIIAANDVTAYAILESLQEHGMTLGRDFGLIGFDGSPLSRIGHFTSIRPAFELLGKIAGSLILQALHGYPLGLHTRVQPELVQRASTTRKMKTQQFIYQGDISRMTNGL